MPETVTPPRRGPVGSVDTDGESGRLLEERYGTGRRRRIDRRFAWGAAGALVLAGVLFVLLSGWQSTNRVSAQDIGFTKSGASEATVKFTVSAPADAPVACAVEALNTSKAPVGWKVVELPVTEQGSHTVTTTLATTAEATAGYVKECWILER